MKKIQDLEKELFKAKEDEALKALEEECARVKAEYEGKAYGSREFERDSKSASDSAIYISKVYLGIRSSSGGKQAILADIWRVNLTRQGKEYKFSRDNYNYSRSRDEETRLSNDRTNAGWNVYQMLPWLKKEISVEKFMSIWQAADKHEIVLREGFKDNLGDYQELIRMGDSSSDGRITKAIESLNIDIVNVQKEYPRIWEIIHYCDLPMFQNQKWIPRLFMKDILEYQISLWEEELRGVFSSIHQHNRRYIQILKDEYLNKL